MKSCILVVEDNQLNRELLRDWLEVEDYEVWCAADLKESYEVFSKRLPDAVLLDINLGKDNGLDLLDNPRPAVAGLIDAVDAALDLDCEIVDGRCVPESV